MIFISMKFKNMKNKAITVEGWFLLKGKIEYKGS